jgi:hypothetical protein
MLGQFYLATATLEKRMDELVANEHETKIDATLVKKVQKLGYTFRSGYERDLQTLLGSSWQETITSWANEPAKRYSKRIQNACDAECAAAVFILHGPLIIGGGAALKPRVEKAFGKDATNVFETVIGAARGGRSRRRQEFIKCYDQLLLGVDQDQKDRLFGEIVDAVSEFMDLNNEMMLAVKQSPWWHKYVKITIVVVVAYCIRRYKVRWRLICTNVMEPINGTTKNGLTNFNKELRYRNNHPHQQISNFYPEASARICLKE